MHIRIKNHFVADLQVTGHARETESEKRIQNTPNKPFTVELVTSLNRGYRPYVISEHSFFYIPFIAELPRTRSARAAEHHG